ncbi:MAG: hypothetical protein AAF492_23705, partial [Verrucomicrobiota bacterium]
ALVRVLHGHSRLVDTLPARWSSDSRTFLTGGSDRMLLVWNRETGQPEHTLLGHTDKIRGYAFSPDDSRIVSRDANGAIKLWDAASGSEVLTIETGTDLASRRRLEWTPDGKTLFGSATVGERWSARRGYDLARTGDLEKDYQLARSAVRRTRLAAEGKSAEAYMKDALGLIENFKVNLFVGEEGFRAAAAAVRAAPKNPDAWVVWAMTLYLDSQWLSVVAKIDRALSLEPGTMQCEGFAVRAAAEYMLGRKEAGDAWAAKAREILPTAPARRTADKMLKHADLARITLALKTDGLQADLVRRQSELMFEFDRPGQAIVNLTSAFNGRQLAIELQPMIRNDARIAERIIRWTGRKVYGDERAEVRATLLDFFDQQMALSPNSPRWQQHRIDLLLAMESETASQIENPHARKMVAAILADDRSRFLAELKAHPEGGREAGFYFSRNRHLEAAAACLRAWAALHP